MERSVEDEAFLKLYSDIDDLVRKSDLPFNTKQDAVSIVLLDMVKGRRAALEATKFLVAAGMPCEQVVDVTAPYMMDA